MDFRKGITSKLDGTLKIILVFHQLYNKKRDAKNEKNLLSGLFLGPVSEVTPEQNLEFCIWFMPLEKCLK